MKSYFAIFLTLHLLLKPLAPVAEYVLNFDYITTVLCINKDKPELKCKGKCYLSKEIAKAAQDDQTPFSKTKNQTPKSIEAFIPSAITTLSLAAPPSFVKEVFLGFKTNYNYSFNGSIFKPPIR
ncbi:hypothetical protein [Bergeyella sp. RCAD1439]|uniref:hypothetical protein n=1 Tax=Bergeyella anatis TaxID=3113737 RepID=UPI002E183F2D|nr:hypothetical protein [Bergeyella sp. RCAD1439]